MIVRDPDRCSGAPTIAGTRIGVHHVVGYARAYNHDLNRVHGEALPHLTLGQIKEAMVWYADNREEIDAILQRQREHYEGMRC